MILPEELDEVVQSLGARVFGAFPWWLRAIASRDVVAITLARRIYVRPATTAGLDRILRHELTHVSQIDRLGLLTFYWRYLSEYVRNRRSGMKADVAYRSISFEREAYEAEERS